MNIIVVSDLHLGKGKFLKNGQLNILEDFFLDEKFYEFLDYYSSGKYFLQGVHLVLNGDILNLIQIDHNGSFSHVIDEENTVASIEKIYQGHIQFFEAIKSFLKTPNKKVSYVIGNHDAGMAFDKAQEKFSELIGGECEFTLTLNIDGVHIEHGHRFEAINTVPLKKYFIEGPGHRKILNLPWGSLFCIMVLPRLKKERPHIDKVRPLSTYIKWLLIHDMLYFFRMLYVVLKYFVKTNLDEFTKQNKNFKTSIQILKQFTLYPRYEKKAKAILKKNINLHTVVMGHTHIGEWRRFPEGKYYFNTGTWNPIPSVDASLHDHSSKLTYCFLETHTKTASLVSGKLNLWYGKWKPFQEEI